MKPNSNPVVIVVDLEATMYSHDIIEIGAVSLVYENGRYKMGKTFHTHVRPTPLSRLDKGTTRLTGITKEDLLKAPCFHKAVNLLLDWIGDREFYFCTWSETDIIFLQKASRKHQRTLDWVQNYNDLQALFGKKWHSGEKNQIGLLAALQEAGVEPTGQHHSALSDAVNTAEIFLKKLAAEDLVKSSSLEEAFNKMDFVRFGYEKRRLEKERLASAEYRKLIANIRRRRKRLYGELQAFSEASSISLNKLRKIEQFTKAATDVEIARMLKTLNSKKTEKPAM